MDMANLLKMGATMFKDSKQSGDAGSGLDIGSLTSALTDLAGGGSSKGGFDLSSLLSKMDSGGLGAIAKTWLGDGSNEAISPDQISTMLGADKILNLHPSWGLATKRRLVVYLRHFHKWWIKPAVAAHCLIQSVGSQALWASLVNYLASRPITPTNKLIHLA